jgi:ABC-type antimicrobial peptide transport system permease subunit
VESLDAAVAGVAIVFMGAVAFIATYVPVRRASGKDPVIVLRSD